MGVLKFRLTSPDAASRLADLRKAYVTGLDRTPSRLIVEIRKDLLICQREDDRERPAVRPLAGRGVRHAVRRHRHPGRAARALPPGRRAGPGQAQRRPEPARRLEADGPADPGRARRDAGARRSRRSSRRRPRRDDPAASSPPPRRASRPAWAAGNLLVEAYTRRSSRPGWPRGQAADPARPSASRRPASRRPWPASGRQAFNAAQVGCRWKSLAPTEGKYRWDELDAQLAWASKQKLAVQAGPLIDFRAGALPDWIWLWEGDFDAILGLAVDLVRQAVARYRGKVPVWHLVHRPGLRRHPRALRGGPDPPHRPAPPGRPPGRPRGAVPRRARPPLGRVDGLQPVPARPAPPGRLPGPRRPGPGRDRPGDRPRLLRAREPPPRPVRLLAAARPLRPAEPPAPRLARHPLGVRPRPPGRPRRPGRGRPVARARPTRRPGGLGRALDRPGGRQAVRPLGHLDADRRRPPHLYPHGGLFRPDQTPKPLVDWLKTFRRELLA